MISSCNSRYHKIFASDFLPILWLWQGNSLYCMKGSPCNAAVAKEKKMWCHILLFREGEYNGNSLEVTWYVYNERLQKYSQLASLFYPWTCNNMRRDYVLYKSFRETKIFYVQYTFYFLIVMILLLIKRDQICQKCFGMCTFFYRCFTVWNILLVTGQTAFFVCR